MTREEAIKELQSYADNSWGGLNEAFEMAIAALKEQGNCCKKGNSWISVEEWLPKKLTDVLVYFADGSTDISRMIDDKFMYEAMYGRATHWMPLPEPPEVVK